MRVLVTGGTGFVGQHLVKLLHARKHKIFSTYLVKPTDTETSAELIPCDIRDRDQVLEALRHACPQHIFHLSALSSVVKSFEDSRQVWQTNVWGAMNLLDAVNEAAPRARVLLVGSSQCYGKIPSRRLPVREEEPLSPASPYAASKAAAEMLGTQFFHGCGLQVIRVRPFNHTGPGQSPEFVCSDLARQVAEIGLGLRSPVLRIGNMRIERDFSDVRDVVRAYELLLRRGVVGDVYNVASGRGISIAEILKHLQSFCPLRFQIEVEQKRVRPGEVSKMCGSNRKLRRVTGWKPEYSLARTLCDLYEFWKSVATEKHDSHGKLVRQPW